MVRRGLTVFRLRTQIRLWLGWTIALCTFFALALSNNLGNFRPLSSDEGGILSVAYKLATAGTLGSDMYAGFFGMDKHWLVTLPAHYFWLALAFRVGGIGIAQARWVSLASALVLIALVGWFSLRWYGLATAMIAQTLLICWRSDLIASYIDLPLISVSRTARYDLDAVAWVWISLVLLSLLIQRPRGIVAFAVGVAAGIATLTQLFGIFVVPLVAIAWFWQRGWRACRESATYWMALGFALTLLPYGLYVVEHVADLRGPMILHEDRIQFNQPEFYLTNFVREPARFSHLVQWPLLNLATEQSAGRPVGAWVLNASVPIAFVYLFGRVKHLTGVADWLLLWSLLVFEGCLTLVEETKAPIYALVVLPSLCILMSIWWTSLWQWAHRFHFALLRFAAQGLLLGLLIAVVVESAFAYSLDQRQARTVSNYFDVGQKINSYLEPAAKTIGAERWWWAIRGTNYINVGVLWSDWLLMQRDKRQTPDLSALLSDTHIQYIIVNNNVRGDILNYPDEVQKQFWNFLDKCATKLAAWADESYGPIEIYESTACPKQD